MRLTLATLTTVAVLLFSGSPIGAQGPTFAETSPARAFVTKHAGSFNGQSVRYVATVGEILLKDEVGVPTASLFSISSSATASTSAICGLSSSSSTAVQVRRRCTCTWALLGRSVSRSRPISPPPSSRPTVPAHGNCEILAEIPRRAHSGPRSVVPARVHLPEFDGL